MTYDTVSRSMRRFNQLLIRQMNQPICWWLDGPLHVLLALGKWIAQYLPHRNQSTESITDILSNIVG